MQTRINPKNIPKLKMQQNRATLESAPMQLQDILLHRYLSADKLRECEVTSPSVEGKSIFRIVVERNTVTVITNQYTAELALIAI